MLYERLYGKSLQKNWNQSFTSSQIVENPELLQSIEDLSEKSKSEVVRVTEKEETPKPTKPEVVEAPKPATVLIATNKQVETRLPSGKRRITPMFLKPAPAPTKYCINFIYFIYCNSFCLFPEIL